MKGGTNKLCHAEEQKASCETLGNWPLGIHLIPEV